MRPISENYKKNGEGSGQANRDSDADDNPFTEIVSKNVMPIPPSKKKVYLEDYEDFVVKLVFFFPY